MSIYNIRAPIDINNTESIINRTFKMAQWAKMIAAKSIKPNSNIRIYIIEVKNSNYPKFFSDLQTCIMDHMHTCRYTNTTKQIKKYIAF